MAWIRRAIFSCLHCSTKKVAPANTSNPWKTLFFERNHISRRILQGNSQQILDEEGFNDAEFAWRRLCETCVSGRSLQHRLRLAGLVTAEDYRMEALQHERLTDYLEDMQTVLCDGRATLQITQRNNDHFVKFCFHSRKDAVNFVQSFRRCNVAYSGISPV